MRAAIEKPFSAACERNREPILAALRPHFADRRTVLEIGSGTGQHAVHFAAAMPQLCWQTSDRAEYLAGIRLWLYEAGLDNTPPPLLLDVEGPWPQRGFDAVFTANTLHIMSWSQVEQLFATLPTVLTDDAVVAIYGPFNAGGAFTSESNAGFDAELKARDPLMGIRDVEAVAALALRAGLALQLDQPMPANNRLLIFKSQP